MNLLKDDAWQPWQAGFEQEGHAIACDNGTDGRVQRGAGQTVVLNQSEPQYIEANVSSRAVGVTGSADSGYSLYLDLTYTDGTTLWGQSAEFGPGTHDWQRRRVVVLPEKPVRQVSVYLLLRGHGGKVWFRDPELFVVRLPDGISRFDGVPVMRLAPAGDGFQVRDIAADSDFVCIKQQALGLKLDWTQSERAGATIFDAQLTDTTGRDRAVTLVYTLPRAAPSLRWLHDPRESQAIEPRREYVNASSFRVANGRLSRYPLAAVADAQTGTALGIDMARPAFFRTGYNAATGELFLSYDLALTPEKPTARVRFCHFAFDPEWAFRAALARYYEIFPDAFRCRTPEQGLWMPFAAISRIERSEDFGFKFKEGTDETAWDDAHNILTFRYTEPMTWWMPLPPDTPRTMDAAWAEARRLAGEGDAAAQALFTSGYRDPQGQIPAQLLDTPWCNGAVWSVNSMPGIQGQPTDFQLKWNAKLRDQLYGPQRSADLDGEYIDSSEGYVTEELDYCREHFAATDTPLTFAPWTHEPAVFRGLIAFEYVRAIATDVHAGDRRMMANSTPIRLCWLAPLLDVMGTETDWNPDGHWQPMSDSDLLYRAPVQGQTVLFSDEHGFQTLLARTRRALHETRTRLRHVPRLLQPQRIPGPLLHTTGALQPRPPTVSEICSLVSTRRAGRLGTRDPRSLERPASSRGTLRIAIPYRPERQRRNPHGDPAPGNRRTCGQPRTAQRSADRLDGSRNLPDP